MKAAKRIAVIAASLWAGGIAFAQDEVEALKKDQPTEIADFIDRIVGCNHWLGEEPYDDARKAEIDAALAALRCDALDADEQALKARYADKPSTLTALETAHELVY